MTNGVKFGDKHSITDWDLLMTSKDIGEAIPKTNYLTIEGRDGSIDLTEWAGEIKYDDSTFTFDFDLFDTNNFWEVKKKISNYLNGRKLKIILDQDPNYYYYGRCVVASSSISYGIGHFTVQATCDPYKLKLNETNISKSVSPDQTFMLENERKSTMPKVTATANIVFSFGEKQFSISPETVFESPDFILKEGNNEIKIISGTGTLNFSYQEGAL